MTIGEFPSEPKKRRAIKILDAHKFDKLHHDPAAARIVDDYEGCVISIPDEKQINSSKTIQKIFKAGLVRPDAILVQSPFDPDSYEEAARAAESFAVEKHMIFSLFCKHLGATAVIVEQVVLQNSEGTNALEVVAGRAGVEGSLSAKKGEVNKFCEKLSLWDIFSGSKPDIDAAEALLEKTALWTDSNMRSLLEMRRDGNNALQERRISLNLSDETKRNLEVVGRLELPSLDLGAGYKQTLKEQKSYSLTINVKF